MVAGIRGSQRRGDGLEPAFVGRDTEFALVKAMLHDTVDRGTARLVTVVGEAGVGKSRLVWEFEKYTDGIAGTLLWHVGRCPRYGDGVAYWALAEVVRARFGIADDDPSDVVATKVADGLARYLDDPVERDFLIPRVGRLVGLDDGEGLSRDELFSGWRLLLERLSQTAPVGGGRRGRAVGGQRAAGLPGAPARVVRAVAAVRPDGDAAGAAGASSRLGIGPAQRDPRLPRGRSPPAPSRCSSTTSCPRCLHRCAGAHRRALRRHPALRRRDDPGPARPGAASTRRQTGATTSPTTGPSSSPCRPA